MAIKRLWELNGLTLAEYTKLYEDQKGVCAICSKAPRTRRLAVDHDHKTGRIRGLLCWKCNNGLGIFLDRVEVLASAVCYIGENQRFPKPYFWPGMVGK